MKLKPIAITVSILIALALASWFARTSSDNSKALKQKMDQPLIDAQVFNQAHSFHFSQGTHSPLVIMKDGDTWRLPEHYGLEIDLSKLKTIVDELVTAKIKRTASSNSANFSQFQLGKISVELKDEAQSSLLKLQIGKTANSGGSYVRLNEDDVVYQAELDLTLDTAYDNWRKKEIFPFNPDKLQTLIFHLNKEKEPRKVTRQSSTDTFQTDNLSDSEELSQSRLLTITRTLANLRFTDITPSDTQEVKEAFKKPLKVTLSTFSGSSFHLELAKLNPKSDKNGKVTRSARAFLKIATEDQKSPISQIMKNSCFEVPLSIIAEIPTQSDNIIQPKKQPSGKSP